MDPSSAEGSVAASDAMSRFPFCFGYSATSNSPRRSMSGERFLASIFFPFYGFYEIAYPASQKKSLHSWLSSGLRSCEINRLLS